MEILVTLIVILFSAIVHEVMHGMVAGWFGDDTARQSGRLTLNPIPHIDPFGTIALPLLMYFTQASLGVAHPIVFGAAKPVPVNINNMRRQRLGMAAVSLAGPLSNFGLAIIGLIALKLGVGSLIPGSDMLLGIIVFYNILLGTFNLIPIPPLDGSKVIASVLPMSLMQFLFSFERYGFILIFILLYAGVLDKILIPVLTLFFRVFGIIV